MMPGANTPQTLGDPATILDRHAIRRAAGVPTVTLLVGPIGADSGTWRRWAFTTGRSVVVASRNIFPTADWIRLIAGQVDLPVAAVHYLANRARRDPDEFLAAWKEKTAADRERFWSTLAPDLDDDLLGALANLVVDQGSRSTVAMALNGLGDRIVPLIIRLVPSALWPSVLFVAGSSDDFSAVGLVAVQWATSVPAVPIAVVVPPAAWDRFLTTAPESRAKALLREGELAVLGIDPVTVERTLGEAGAMGSAVTALAMIGPDAALVESAVSVVRATAAPPTTQEDDDRARSAAERFLFAFLESLPETAGRFEMNASLDFPFGPRAAEVDLLCRSPQIAVELDGYFHFLAPDSYRRDRTKDWELQRRGYLVLRFLAEDVFPKLEMIRDRILDAFSVSTHGEQS
jgi:hypothetical protein